MGVADDVAVNQADEGAIECELADVTPVPLSRLLNSADSALALAVERVLRELDEANDIISGWQSFVG